MAAGSSSEQKVPTRQAFTPNGAQPSADTTASASDEQRQKGDSPVKRDASAANERGQPPQPLIVPKPATTSANAGSASPIQGSDVSKNGAAQAENQKLAGVRAQLPQDVLATLISLERDGKEVLAQTLVKRIGEGLTTVKQHGGAGYAVIGRLNLPTGVQAQDVIGPVTVLDDGYFVDVVATSRIPVSFWHPDCTRVDVFPKPTEQRVVDLGTIPVRRRAGPLASIQGTVPWNVASHVSVEVKALPKITNTAHRRADWEKATTTMSERLAAAFPSRSVTAAGEPEFRVEGLPAGQLAVRVTAEGYDGRTYASELVVSVADGERLSLGMVPLTRLSLEEGAPPAADLTDRPWASDGKPALERMLKKIKPQSAQDDFKVRCDAIMAEVERLRDSGTEKTPRAAVLLVGRVKPPSTTIRPEQVVTDVFVDSQGHFVACVQPGKPVGFRLHGFLPLDYTPKGSMDGVEFAGELSFKKTPLNQSATVIGQVRLEGTQPPGQLRISAKVLEDNINRVPNRPDTDGGDRTSFTPQVEYRGNSFRITELSPIRYRLLIDYPRYGGETVTVTLKPRQNLNLGTVVLHESQPLRINTRKAVRFHYLVAKSGRFAEATPATATLSERLSLGPNGEHYLPIRFDEENRLILQTNYPSQTLLDLGVGKITDFQHVNARNLPEGVEVSHKRLLGKDHVYLMYRTEERLRSSWLLFQAEAALNP
jgi:hypothetical protein